jgi:hypothetical protein
MSGSHNSVFLPPLLAFSAVFLSIFTNGVYLLSSSRSIDWSTPKYLLYHGNHQDKMNCVQEQNKGFDPKAPTEKLLDCGAERVGGLTGRAHKGDKQLLNALPPAGVAARAMS